MVLDSFWGYATEMQYCSNINSSCFDVVLQHVLFSWLSIFVKTCSAKNIYLQLQLSDKKASMASLYQIMSFGTKLIKQTPALQPGMLLVMHHCRAASPFLRYFPGACYFEIWQILADADFVNRVHPI